MNVRAFYLINSLIVIECWHRVFGSRVSVTDPVSDSVFVAFARALLLLLGREYATLESVRLRLQ